MNAGRLVRLAAAITAVVWTALAAPASALDIEHVANPLGIDAWLVREDSTPTLAMAFDFAGGSSQDPADRRGLTNLFVGLLYEGAGDLDSPAYKAALKAGSVQLGWDFDRDSLYGIVLTPTANVHQAARLMNLAMTTPRYDTEAVERVRALIVSGARSRTPAQAGILGFMAALFPGHIYGSWESGDLDSLAAVTVADMQAYRQKAFALDNLKIVAVGDIDAAGLSALIVEAFANLPPIAQLAPIPDAKATGRGRIDTVAAVAQTTIRFGGPGVKRSDPDFVAASVAATILGGRGTSRLFDALVTKGGLATNVALTLNWTAHGGWYAGNTSVRPEDSDAVVAAIDREARRLATEGPTADEIARAQGNLVGALLSRFDSSPGAATELVSAFAAGLGPDYAERYVDAVAAVTTADVKRAAGRLFGGGMLFFTTGPAATP